MTNTFLFLRRFMSGLALGLIFAVSGSVAVAEEHELGRCKGKLFVSPDKTITVSGSVRCSRVQLKDPSGTVIYPTSYMRADPSVSTVAVSPSVPRDRAPLAIRLVRKRADNGFEGVFHVPLAILESAASIEVRSYSGATAHTIPLPPHPRLEVMNSAAGFQGEGRSGNDSAAF